MPKRCSICKCSTLNEGTFQVTKNRIETWKELTKENFKIGARICQSHFPQEVFVKRHNYNKFKTYSSRVSFYNQD